MTGDDLRPWDQHPGGCMSSPSPPPAPPPVAPSCCPPGKHNIHLKYAAEVTNRLQARIRRRHFSLSFLGTFPQVNEMVRSFAAP